MSSEESANIGNGSRNLKINRNGKKDSFGKMNKVSGKMVLNDGKRDDMMQLNWRSKIGKNEKFKEWWNY